MPWHIEDDNPECDGFAVVKNDDGAVEGCHKTKDDAKTQMAALYANEDDEGKTLTVTGPARKALKVDDLQADGQPGEFTAHFSVFDVLDSDGDYVRKGAFAKAFEHNPNPAIVWTHRWDIPPIGETLDVTESDKGAIGHGRLFVDDHDVARQVFAGLKSGALRQFSYSYDVAQGGGELREAKEDETPVREDGMIRELTEFAAIHEWGPTLVGANPATEVLSTAKSLETLLGVRPVNPPDLVVPAAAYATGTNTAATTATSTSGGQWEKAGARNNASDRERLQAIHDYAVENGAQCAKAGHPHQHPDRPDAEAALALVFAQPRRVR